MPAGVGWPRWSRNLDHLVRSHQERLRPSRSSRAGATSSVPSQLAKSKFGSAASTRFCSLSATPEKSRTAPRFLAGIGHVAVGMRRQGYDLNLTQYDDRGWRATFYTTGKEHSPASATGTG